MQKLRFLKNVLQKHCVLLSFRDIAEKGLPDQALWLKKNEARPQRFAFIFGFMEIAGQAADQRGFKTQCFSVLFVQRFANSLCFTAI